MSNIVVFIDEIDSTINFPFSTDDFFAAIRTCYNARVTNSEFRRLTFVLLGTATPSDLMKDKLRTPFNIGYQIDLTDFTFNEAKPLAVGFGINQQENEKILKYILYWTSGHPYLTQNLCKAVETEKSKDLSEQNIARVVDKKFPSDEVNPLDTHLGRIQEFLLYKKKIQKNYSIYIFVFIIIMQ